MGSRKTADRIFDWIFYSILSIAYTGSLAFIAWYVYYTWDYLTLPVVERHFHEQHAQIKPGGFWGHGFGVVGTFMIIIMHVYSIRKRFKFFRNWGSLQKWLHFHIYMGVVGSLLVMVHSTGKVNGLVSLSFWSMVLVFLSGFVGRFFYGAIPRRATGLAYSLDEAADLSEKWSTGLKRSFAKLGDSSAHIESLETRRDVNRFLGKYVKPISHVGSLRGCNEAALYTLRPIWGLSHQMIRDIKEHQNSDASWNSFLHTRKAGLRKRKFFLRRKIKTIEKAASIKRKVQRWKSIQARLYYWHVFHKPLSVIMYTILFVHVYVAVKYGFVWIF